MNKTVDYDSIVRRYEQLKQMYFKSSSSNYDEDGEEIPSVVSRLQIVQMFENMGVELPLTPSDPIKFRR